jgi:hydrogenase expression/formation protein HypD
VKYLDEFRDGDLIRALAERIAALSPAPATFMEVCGTHTMAIARYGLRQLLPAGVRLISGPGCPVCVTPQAIIDQFIALGRRPDVILACFGDMIRVPGSVASLEHEQAAGADLRIVASALEALALAGSEPDRQVIFFGVGFETTAPSVALALRDARDQQVANFSVLSAHKLIPPALRALAGADDVRIDGFLLPGHVSAIIGADAYRFLADEFGRPCAIAGFEPVDVLRAVELLIEQLQAGWPEVAVEYGRVVRADGNPAARQAIAEVFEPADSEWRGLGVLPMSGLAIREPFAAYDAARRFPVEAREAAALAEVSAETGCRCGDVLRGLIEPPECALFDVACRPSHPLGPCMVSSEGACAAYHRYRGEHYA